MDKGSYQKTRQLILSNPKKLGKFWHVCIKCGNKQFTKKFMRNCKRCGNKNTAFFVNYNGDVYPELQEMLNIEKVVQEK